MFFPVMAFVCFIDLKKKKNFQCLSCELVAIFLNLVKNLR